MKTNKLLVLIMWGTFFGIPGHSQVLNVVAVTQEQDQWCWAGSSACILQYHCATTAQCNIAEYTRTVATWHSFGTTNCCVNPSLGCNYWNYNWGYPGSIQDILIHFAGIQNPGVGSYLSQATITSQITNNRTFVIRWGWSTGGGHFLVGHGQIGNSLYYMDPWFGEGLKIADYSWVVSGSSHTWTHTNQVTTSSPRPYPAGTISGSTSLSQGQTNVAYSVPVITNATSYNWIITPTNAGTFSSTGSSTYLNLSATYSGSATITVKGQSSCGSGATSSPLAITVSPCTLPSQPGAIGGSSAVCQGSTNTYSVTAVSGATSYTWTLPSGWSGSSTSTSINATAGTAGGTIYVKANNGCGSGPQQSKSVTVTPPGQAGVAITASANPVCSGTAVTFTATPSNGGTAPAYQWKVNGTNVSGATNVSYTSTPVNGNTVICIMTSNASCITGSPATSNTITMAVNATVAAGISISASANTVCAGTQVTYTATPTNGGSAPGYQWKLNGTSISGATSATYLVAPAANNAISCMMTSNATCVTGSPATSNAITVTISPALPVGVVVATSGDIVCSGNTIDCMAIPSNGGTSPSYQWRLNGNNVAGATSVFYSFIPLNGNTVSCVLTSNAGCTSGNPATSSPVTITVNPWLPVSISIASSANPVQAGSPVTVTATPVNGGSAPQYQWKVNGINAGSNSPLFTYNPVNYDTIECLLNSSLYCGLANPATSNSITLMVAGASCPGLATVAHGGKTYNTVQIGTQCWLKENLNYGLKINGAQEQTNNSVIEKYCYNDLESNCDIYGGHYQWGEALQYVSAQGVKGICPQGWHIPADAEWTILTDLLNGPAEAGGKMKEQGSLHWASPNTGATNFSGFTALPGGSRSPGSFSTLTTYGYFWSSSVYDDLNAWRVLLRNDGAQTNLLNNLKTNGYSVRCLKDELLPTVRFLENIVIPNGQNKCYNATRTITVAGNGTAFAVMNGGAATMIAGKSILCYPGTTVAAGGYLHGYIAPSGPFCPIPAMPAVIAGNDQPITALTRQSYKLYPNPTTGKLTLEFSAEPAGAKLFVRVFNMMGAEITGKTKIEARTTEISLENQSPGIYLVGIMQEGKMETVKIVKQ